MNKKEKTYPVSTMAIQNRVTECFKSMSVDEKRILIMASPVARNIDATEQDSILISAQQFAEECGIKVNSAYKQIEIASKKLVVLADNDIFKLSLQYKNVQISGF